MTAVRLPEAEVRGLLAAGAEELAVAAVNAPGLCVVSGPLEAVEKFEQLLASQQMASRRLKTSHAFHSAMMDAVVDPFAAQVKSVTLRAPQIPFVSNVTGKWITAAQARSPGRMSTNSNSWRIETPCTYQ